jgi:nitroreductase/dihydropteridine reductase
MATQGELTMSILKAMQWRYATKKFDGARRLDRGTIDDLLNTVNLAPSSFGLQPYRIVDVGDAALRERIAGTTMNPAQVNSASHLLVFAASNGLGKETVANFIDRAAAIRHVPRESLAAREAQVTAAVEKLDPPGRLAWAQRQTYLAIGVLVAAAAQSGVDACPMEGFDAAAVDGILGLDAQGYRATVFVLLGHRAEDDPFAPLAKVRKPLDQLVVTA